MTAVKENIPLAPYTTFGIGGTAKYFCEPVSDQEVRDALHFATMKVAPVFIMGSGSNLLVADSGFNGLVIHLEKNFAGIHREGDRFDVLAGTSLMKLSLETAKLGYGDLIFASGIPGTVGGALRMNAGAYGGEISTPLVKLKYITPQLEIRERRKDEVQFGYRTSSLANEIILEGTFLLKEKSPPDLLMERRKELLQKRKNSQPLEYPNAGSIFKNPMDGPAAGQLIEKAGLKGLRVGDAQVSEKHGNFIVNLGHATASDVMTLIKLIRKKVSEQSGITLELETKTLGEFNL